MKGIPEKIYLQIGDIEKHEKFIDQEVTWCRDKIDYNDIEYLLISNELKKYLLDHEEDIISNMNDFGYLYQIFIKVMNRKPELDKDFEVKDEL